MIRKKRVLIAYLLSIILLLLPYIWDIYYSLPSADDFSMLYNYNYNKSIWLEAVRISNGMWHNWTGEWFYTLIQIIVNPLLLFKYSSHGIGIELIILFLFFIFSIMLSIKTVFKNIFNCGNNIIIYAVTLITLIMILNTDIYTEIFYWFVGSTYMLAVALSFLCITLMVVSSYNINTKRYVLMLSVLGFFTCMGLTVAGVVCLIYACILFKLVREKKRYKMQLISMVCCFLGAIISVAAPGNYIRHARKDPGGLNFIKAFRDALFTECVFGYSLLRKMFIGLGLLGIFLILYFVAREKHTQLRFINPIKAFGLFFVCIFVVIFPVVLGYAHADVPNRIAFIINTYMVLGLAFCMGDLGAWAGNKCNDPVSYETIRLTIMILAIAIYIGPLNRGNLGNLPYIEQIKCHSDVVASYNDWMNIFGEIVASQDKDVIVNVKQLHSDSILKSPGLGDDKNNWVNYSIAAYFKKNSIKLIVNE
jgi:hypothetical protein